MTCFLLADGNKPWRIIFLEADKLAAWKCVCVREPGGSWRGLVVPSSPRPVASAGHACPQPATCSEHRPCYFVPAVQNFLLAVSPARGFYQNWALGMVNWQQKAAAGKGFEHGSGAWSLAAREWNSQLSPNPSPGSPRQCTWRSDGGLKHRHRCPLCWAGGICGSSSPAVLSLVAVRITSFPCHRAEHADRSLLWVTFSILRDLGPNKGIPALHTRARLHTNIHVPSDTCSFPSPSL